MQEQEKMGQRVRGNNGRGSNGDEPISSTKSEKPRVRKRSHKRKPFNIH